jgi:hypothetical protein
MRIPHNTTDASYIKASSDEGVFFLQKPFTPDTVVAKVREVLDASAPKTTPLS